MVRVISDGYKFKNDILVYEEEGHRYVTIDYDKLNENDRAIMDEIENIIDKRQKLCSNCVHLKTEGCFCGYCAHYCDADMTRNVESWNFDFDGSKCKDYERK